eukprot:1052233-Amphidinium_carterae.1
MVCSTSHRWWRGHLYYALPRAAKAEFVTGCMGTVPTVQERRLPKRFQMVAQCPHPVLPNHGNKKRAASMVD